MDSGNDISVICTILSVDEDTVLEGLASLEDDEEDEERVNYQIEYY